MFYSFVLVSSTKQHKLVIIICVLCVYIYTPSLLNLLSSPHPTHLETHNRLCSWCYSATSHYYMSGECILLGSLSRHNKDLEWWTLKPPRRVTALGSWTDRVIALRSRTDHVIALRQISVTALFYLEDSRKIHLQGVRARQSKDAKRRAPQCVGERERES